MVVRSSECARVTCWLPCLYRRPPGPGDGDLPEEQLEERSISTLEEEALPYSITHEQAGEHAPQEDMAVELSQDRAAEEPLDTVNESGEANEHAPQEHLVLEPPQAGAEEPPLHPLEVALSECESASPHDCCPQTPDEYMVDNEDSETMSDNSLIIALENGKNVISDDEKDQEEQV
ncbi:hypothetical protein MJG53_010941 [Ovis ammon polii x Ovis aries]|uniref:Uncharacterized protein n=1 Tax=Ovis ammon polii x Ovis aries TaxID=2918886 RepID=A0ACB9URZ4_9CETA|nr:hypothetical protein MJG53_010941 [Ovis ammon polii x Ovis aries]